MVVNELLDRLGYSSSPNFLKSGSSTSFQTAVDFGHVFRRAQKPCNLRGVYSLRHTEASARDTIVPVVYVCEADNESHAQEIHRKVWNQNVVPFLIVAEPKTIRLYSGFCYTGGGDDEDSGLLEVARDMSEAVRLLNAFHAERIDDGSVWDEWGAKVRSDTKVDWRLLSSLNALDTWLQSNGVEDPKVSHALIGKYVYLHYLRQRGILSDKWLSDWGIEASQLFGRRVQASVFWRVVEKLDERLNGSVFPLPALGSHRPKVEHIRKVATTFSGDDPTSGQTTFDFVPYDFSFIPIETLSVIYEQFLHAPRADGETSAGKRQGAYYTPLPLVNFMLEELDSLRPLKQGMRVLDPACGSGAFLVQCYRRLIERDEEYDPSKSMRPARLRDLLTEHIFGVDCDEDACRVARLSLTLTLLDYVSPPDLRNTPQFRLPDLQDSNILRGDFFDPEAPWRSKLQDCRFDWIVGNPPWVEIKSGRVAPEQQHIRTWMQEHNRPDDCPMGGNQVAEAFAWKATEHLAEKGCAALVLPAMTLFKDESQEFRQRFFEKHRVHSVANFANLAEVLFPRHCHRTGKQAKTVQSQRPAAVFFYSQSGTTDSPETISVFSPLVAQQRANRPDKPGGRKDTWSIVVDNSQIRTVELRDVADGSALPWKTAMWGSSLDLRLLKAVAARHELFRAFCERNSLNVAEGFQLRTSDSREPIERIPEVVGELELVTKGLAKSERIFEFPSGSLRRITPEGANLRLRGGTAGLAISRPPHIIVHRTRRFAVFSDTFLVVPPRQIGIAGKDDQTDLLKALSLYLVSDFAVYHQFLVCPEWGISTSSSTLGALKLLPVPFSDFKEIDLSEWARLHEEIVAAARNQEASSTPLFDRQGPKSASLDALLKDLNDRVYAALRLRPREQALVRDLVHVRMDLIKGKVSEAATREPSDPEVRKYALMLADELDGFVEDQPALKHSVCVFRNGKAAIVRVRLHRSSRPDTRVRIEQADAASAKDLAKIREQLQQRHSQWIYFQRDLRLYEGRNTYLFKPQERLHWTESQAILDAGTIIADTLS